MPVQEIMHRSVDRQWFCPPQSQAYSLRLTWLAIAALLWAGLIFAKLVSLQVIHHKEYARLARQQQELRVSIPAPRGPIFDRTGQPLAMSIPVESVFVNPLRIPVGRDWGNGGSRREARFLSMEISLTPQRGYGDQGLSTDPNFAEW